MKQDIKCFGDFPHTIKVLPDFVNKNILTIFMVHYLKKKIYA